MEYKISNRLRMSAIVMVVLGILGVAYGFYDSHHYKTVEDVKELLASEHHGGHGEAHATEAHGESDSHAVASSHGDDEMHAEEGHHMSHEEHVLHQIHNRPWAAIYVGAFFFFMIALGVLAFNILCITRWLNCFDNCIFC